MNTPSSTVDLSADREIWETPDFSKIGTEEAEAGQNFGNEILILVS